MPKALQRSSRLTAVVLAAVMPVALAACGASSSSSSGKPTVLSVSIAEKDKTAKYTVPSSVEGGLVALSLKNSGRRPHAAQLLRLEGGHTAKEALKVIAAG